MPRPLAHNLNALVAAIALAAILPAFAQTKPPPLVGLTRDQVIAELGDPKSNIKAGAREMLFFEHLKVTFRNSVAIETEAIADETAPVARHTPDATAPATGAASASGAAPAATPAPAPAPPQINPEGGTMAVPIPAAPVAAPASDPATSAKAPPPKAPEAVLSIKKIKSGGATKSAPRSTPPAASSTAGAATPNATPAATKAEPKPATSAIADTKQPPTATAATTTAPAATPVKVETKEEPATVAEAETPAADEGPAKPAVDAKKKAAVRHRWRLRRDAETEEEGVIYIPLQSYIIAFVTIAAGIWFLRWRWNQRNLELAATAVSHTPFAASMSGTVDTAGTFTAEMIAKLGPKKFERLVASYYAKTGVVAEQTNTGPDSPVHIKIFWKGEPKPFAGVQCHANPPTLIGPKPLLDLFTALSTADIRRGYVVTTGKFNVEARDVGEEKHFTLLSGDIFLEKLNALPPAARGELLKETSAEEPAAPITGLTT